LNTAVSAGGAVVGGGGISGAAATGGGWSGTAGSGIGGALTSGGTVTGAVRRLAARPPGAPGALLAPGAAGAFAAG
jgi:hypothetical protein